MGLFLYSLPSFVFCGIIFVIWVVFGRVGLRIALNGRLAVLGIFLLGGAVTMTTDRLYKSFKNRQWKRMLKVPEASLAERVEEALLSREDAHKLYQIMQAVHEVFGELGITYWADGGTMLGAVRNKGIIPTDDDLDICFLKKDEPRMLMDVKEALAARGLGIYKSCELYRIFFLADKEKGERYYYMDVSPMAQKNDDVLIYSDGAYSRWYHRISETFPLRLVSFGPLKIYVSRDPEAHLYRGYGTWNRDAYITKHGLANPFKPFTTPMTPELRKPAPWRAGFEYIKGQPAPLSPVIDFSGEYAARKKAATCE